MTEREQVELGKVKRYLAACGWQYAADDEMYRHKDYTNGLSKQMVEALVTREQSAALAIREIDRTLDLLLVRQMESERAKPTPEKSKTEVKSGPR